MLYERLAQLSAINEDMTLLQLRTFLCVVCFPNRSQQWYAGRTGVGKSAMSRQVDRLSRMGLISKRVDIDDRRNHRLSPTLRGVSVANHIEGQS